MTLFEAEEKEDGSSGCWMTRMSTGIMAFAAQTRHYLMASRV